ncbi:unnamed protein product [Larinioides sclopetarius]|uniref:Uncharacterized protein n=1 Tax=Larinioides sclopetarius TaxID=280406 RepID=A0AAV1YTT0_9ARAC
MQIRLFYRRVPLCTMKRYWLVDSVVENLTAANWKLNKLPAHGGRALSVATYNFPGLSLSGCDGIQRGQKH